MRWTSIITAAWILIGGAAFALPFIDLPGPVYRLLEPFRLHISSDKALYSPAAYFVLLTAVFVLERRMPVRQREFLSPSFRYDLLWYFASVLFNIALVGYFVLWLHAVYHNHFSFLTIDAVAGWHPLAKFIFGVLLADFTRWLSHLVRHKVPLFWSFHAVHHSQSDLNIFTDARGHPIDSMISSTIRLFPMMVFGNPVPVIMAWLIFETIYPKFYHANIRLNMGPLRYLLVTPQSHRVHHGIDVAYRDTNFGFTFSIWDRMFGTQYPDDFDYPDTGIEDKAFPQEAGLQPLPLVRVLIQQLVYPFKRIAGSVDAAG